MNLLRLPKIPSPLYLVTLRTPPVQLDAPTKPEEPVAPMQREEPAMVELTPTATPSLPSDYDAPGLKASRWNYQILEAAELPGPSLQPPLFS